MGTGLIGLGEKRVNFNLDGTTDGVTGTQADPAVTALSDGNFLVVYESPQAGGTNIDLLAHFFDASGNAINPPVLSGLSNGVVGIDRSVDVTTHPAIAATANGGFVVAYTDVTQNAIDVRRYDSTTGVVSAPFVIDNGNAPNHQPNVGPVDNATIATFADGTMIVVWEFDFANSATDHDVFFAYLNSTASGFVRNVAPLDVHNEFEGEARVATSGNTAAIVYAADPGTINGGQDIILNLFNSSGTEIAAPATIFGTSSSDVFSHPDVAALSDGSFVIVAQDDTAARLVASIYDPITHGATPLVALGGITGTGISPHVAGVPGGGFVMSFDNPTGEIVELRVGPGGSFPFDTAGPANSFMTGTQDQNAIASNATGTVFFAWQDAGSGNPNSTDTDTRIEAQAFHLQLLITSNGGGDTATLSIAENTTAVTTVIATEPGASTLSYSIVGGADAGKFQIDASTGALSFITAPDFEGPLDVNHDNSYIVQVRASDGSMFDDQAVTVNVTDVFEQPVALIGGPDPDTLTGGPGNDVLDGQGGNDTLIGSSGHDLYYVQDVGDVIVENPNEGLDSVIAFVTYTLPANVESIYALAGSGATGNDGDNLLDGAFAGSGQTLDGQGGNDVIYGTFFDDTLIGGAGSDALYDIGGNDTMQGGAGDDAYFVNSTADVVQENASEGQDAIYASVNFTLPANVEILEPYGAATRGDGNDDANVLLGVASDHGLTLDGHGGNDVIYGSNFDDTLIGGAGDDLLWGFGGNDTMQGGTGNDTYIVEQAGDVVQENPGEGNDTIYASVNITLPTNVENLFVYGAATSGIGNAADNYIVNEFITSGVTLTGAGGNDTFVFIPGTAAGTTITDFVGNGAGVGDVLEFAAYGAGATFTNIDATHWQVNYNGGASHDVITFSNAAAIDPSDVLFA